ncbi:MAG: hypothetical protein ACKVZ0_24775 [Gemmatimonadales bacterium]
MSIWFAKVYGLGVRSEVEVADWPAVAPCAVDIEVRRANLSSPPFGTEPQATRWEAVDGGLLVAVTGVGRFAAREGRLIEVDADPGAKREDLDLYLSGAMLGAVLHQRGLFPLHAAAVAHGGVAVAIAGESSAGKSTLAATLVATGGTFLTDDSSVLDFGRGGVSLWPGARRLKLDKQSLGLLRQSPGEDLASAGGTRGKYHAPVEAPLSSAGPVPLARVYLLTDGSGPPRLERLAGLEAVSAIADHAHFLVFAIAMGRQRQIFQLAARAAGGLEVYRLIRPRGLEQLPAIAELVRAGSPTAEPRSEGVVA